MWRSVGSAARSPDRSAVSTRVVSLLTADQGVMTGGHSYNHSMAERAPRHGVLIETTPVEWGIDLGKVPGQIVVDSLVAAKVATGLRGRGLPPLSALVHQVPGGVEGSRARRKARRLADLAVYRRCALLIAASDYLAEELARAGIPRDRIRVVPPGRDLPAQASTPGPRGRSTRMVVINVANWLPDKGILDLLDGMSQVPTGEAVLHLIGSPGLEPRFAGMVEARLRRSDLLGKVVLHGAVPRSGMHRWYEGADLLVLPSRNEGYGTVVAEALGYGVPVVASRSGNLPNLIEDGMEGLLLPPGDVAGLAEAIRRLAGDRELLSRMASQAAARGRQLPTWDVAAERFFAALAEVPGN